MRYWVLCSIAAILNVGAMAQGGASQRVDVNVPRTMSLVLQPSRIDTGKKYTLLPLAGELKDGDAGVVYKKAIEALPKNLAANQTREWLSELSSNGMPLDKAQALVQQAQASLQLAAQGATFKNCSPVQQQSDSSGSTPVRHLGTLLCIKAHLEIMQKRYDDAVATIRTSLAMSKHIAENSRLIYALTAVAMMEATLQRVAELAQAPGSPNLLPALKALPQPLIDMEDIFAGESAETAQGARRIPQRLRGTVAGLECIEALRHYAATHNNQLPTKLSDISDVQLPNDPATDKPFAYRLEGSKAILEVSPPKGDIPRGGMRYEITVAH